MFNQRIILLGSGELTKKISAEVKSARTAATRSPWKCPSASTTWTWSSPQASPSSAATSSRGWRPQPRVRGSENRRELPGEAQPLPHPGAPALPRGRHRHHRGQQLLRDADGQAHRRADQPELADFFPRLRKIQGSPDFQARDRPVARSAFRAPARALSDLHGHPDQAGIGRPRFLHPGEGGGARSQLHGVQVPVDGPGRREAQRAGLGAGERPAHDAGREHHAPAANRRAAPDLECAQGRDELRRPAARARHLRAAVGKGRAVLPERFTVKPGITGWAQVNYGYGASVADAIEKLNYDLFYIKNMSIMMDLLVSCARSGSCCLAMASDRR